MCRLGLGLLTLLTLPVVSQAAVFSWEDPSAVTVNPTSLQQTQDGVTVTAQGYAAEISGGDATVLGPFPTGTGQGGFTVFGLDISVYNGLGLMAQSIGGITTVGSDIGSAVIAPGINSFYWSPVAVSDVKFDFVHFAFDAPVDIGAVVVDDVSNFDRNVWMATGSSAPDFSGGFLGGLTGYAITNSPDDFGDGEFSHPLNASDVLHLLVGAPPQDGLGDLSDGSSQFTIISFDAEAGDGAGNGGGNNGGGGNGGPEVIPVPPTLALLLSGLLGMAGIASRRRRPPSSC